MPLRRPPIIKVESDSPHLLGFGIPEETALELRELAVVKDIETIQLIGAASGKIVMRELFPQANIGNVVNILHSAFGQQQIIDSKTGYRPLLAYLEGGVAGSLEEIQASNDPQVARLF